jgi:hypothetical protein
MVWQGDNQGQQWGGGQAPQDNSGWSGYPPPSGPGYGTPGGYGDPGGYGNPGGYGGYGGPGGPGGYGMPPGFPPPARKSSAGIVIAIVAVVIVLVGGGVGAAVLLSGGHKKKNPPVAVSSQPAAPAQPSPGPSTPPAAKAAIPGWNAVVAVEHGVTYDVPPNWSVKTSGTIIGFEDSSGNPEVAGSGAATYKQGYCQGHSGSWRAESAVTGYSTTDPALDALDAAHKWATDGYAPTKGHPAPVVTLSGARAVKVGGLPGQEATATVTVRDRSDPCAPPRAVVHTVAGPAKGGKVPVLIVIADQGVSGAALDADLMKIAGSLRPTP